MSAVRPTRFAQFASLVGTVALAVVAAGPARGQDGLRVVQEGDRVDGNRFIVAGRVFNESQRDALDVSVTVEALDGSKKVVASGIAFVSSLIPPQGSAAFSAKVPRVPTANSFRVAISSYRFGLKSESPKGGSPKGESP
jgi:hypothetical protein